MRGRSQMDKLLVAVVSLGIVLRVVQYLWRRSYWHDEAFFVLNVIDGRPSDALGPLAHQQSTPPLFLWIEFAAKAIGGTGEYAMRAAPLAFGCVSVVLFAVLARRVAGPLAAFTATAMFAVSDRLVWHSVEAKQYSSDVFVAVLLLLVAVAGGSARQRLVRVAASAAVAVWLSHPAIFVFGGVSLAQLAALWREGRRPAALATFALAALPVVVSFAAMYFWSARHQQYPSLFNYWAGQMVPWTQPLKIPGWFLSRMYRVFDYPCEDLGTGVMILSLVGVIHLWRTHQRQRLALLTLPMLLTLFASALHRYPFGAGRVNVFLVPSVLLMTAAGIDALRLLAKRHVAELAAALLVVWGSVLAVRDVFVPKHNGHLRPAAEFARDRRRADEPVYVLGETETLECYWRGPGVGLQAEPATFDRIADTRFWVVYAYGTRRGQRQRDTAVESAAATRTILDRFEIEGGAAYHFGPR